MSDQWRGRLDFLSDRLLGRSPFETESRPIEADIGLPAPVEEIQIDQDIDTWEKEAKGRFDYLRSTKIDKDKEDPFQSGFWQGSFVLTGFMSSIGLKDFLEVLRDSFLIIRFYLVEYIVESAFLET